MYFRTIRGGQSYTATLFLNTATNTTEINEFGWFQTNSTGTLNGTKHVLFRGSGITHNLTPDPVGTTVTFTPTQYFGFYYSDVSDEEDDNGPPHGCWASTIFAFNDEDCTAAGDANNTVRGTTSLQSSSSRFPARLQPTGSRARIPACAATTAIAISLSCGSGAQAHQTDSG